VSGGDGVARLEEVFRLEETTTAAAMPGPPDTGDLLPGFVVDSSDVLSGVVFGLVVLEPGVLAPLVPLSSPCCSVLGVGGVEREELRLLLVLEDELVVVTFFSELVPG